MLRWIVTESRGSGKKWILRSAITPILPHEIVHFVSDPITKIVAQAADLIEACYERTSAVLRQGIHKLQRILEGPQHGVEPTVPCHAHILTESRRLLAVVDHQFGQSLWLADRFLIVGNGLLGFGNRYVLVP